MVNRTELAPLLARYADRFTHHAERIWKTTPSYPTDEQLAATFGVAVVHMPESLLSFAAQVRELIAANKLDGAWAVLNDDLQYTADIWIAGKMRRARMFLALHKNKMRSLTSNSRIQIMPDSMLLSSINIEVIRSLVGSKEAEWYEEYMSHAPEHKKNLDAEMTRIWEKDLREGLEEIFTDPEDEEEDKELVGKIVATLMAS